MKKVNVLSAVLLGVFILGYSFYSYQAAAQEDQAKWRAQMQDLKRILSDLLPLVVSEKQFNAPRNEQLILERTAQLAELSHELRFDKPHVEAMPADTDPSLIYLATLFEDEMDLAFKVLQAGNRDYARKQLQAVTGFCIGCHSRTGFGPSFKGTPLTSGTAGLDPLDKAELFAATRQFDKAYKTYGTYLNMLHKPVIESEVERAIRHGLSITIRVQQDPVRSVELIDTLLANDLVPETLAADAKIWRKAAEEWQSEITKAGRVAKPSLEKAQNLITQAEWKQKKFSKRAADVELLRASAILHNYLREHPYGNTTARALYLIGQACEALSELDLWTLHDLYYEACIHYAPGTSTAQRCYQRYSESTAEMFSGSGGMHLPRDVEEKLQALKEVAY